MEERLRIIQKASFFYRIRFKTLKNNVHHTQYIYFEGSRYFIHCTRDTWSYGGIQNIANWDESARWGIYIYSLFLFLSLSSCRSATDFRTFISFHPTRFRPVEIQTICLWQLLPILYFRIVNVINNYATITRRHNECTDHPSQCTLFWSSASTTT